jgi:CRP-like cAMP-binding protein
LFADLDEASLAPLSAALASEEYQPGDVLMRQGDPGTSFLIVLVGVVVVSREDSNGSQILGTVGQGSTVGELAVLTKRPRHATVTAVTSVRAAVGGEDAFELALHSGAMHERLIDIAAPRFAAVADRAPVTVPGGGQLFVRPLVPTDRHELAAAFARQSEEFIRHRFFGPSRPTWQMIDDFVNINYVDHFAWAVSSDDSGRSVADARYVRLQDGPEVAEIAFDVFDGYRGRGLATLLLGALAEAASSAGVTRFVAQVLYENWPMRAVLGKAGARWEHYEPGVISGSIDVSAAQSLIKDPLRSELARTARPVVTAAGLAPHAPCRVPEAWPAMQRRCADGSISQARRAGVIPAGASNPRPMRRVLSVRSGQSARI